MAPQLWVKEQEQLENIVAAALRITAMGRALTYQVIDPDSLTLLTSIMAAAASIRRNVIGLTKARKEKDTMTNMQQAAWDAASNPKAIVYSNDVYGQIEMDVWFCTLKKGVGKQPYIDGVDKLGDRRTAVDISIADVGGNNYKRSFIAEIGADGWKAITLPSIEALGFQPQQIDRKYVHAEMVAFGKFTGSDGVEKNKTAPKILAVYQSLEECEAAAQGAPQQTDWLTNPPAASANGNGAAPNGASPAANDEAERATAAQFLLPLARMARRGNGIDAPTMEGFLTGNPILAKHFNLASLEVTQAMAAALEEAPF